MSTAQKQAGVAWTTIGSTAQTGKRTAERPHHAFHSAMEVEMRNQQDEFDANRYGRVEGNEMVFILNNYGVSLLHP